MSTDKTPAPITDTLRHTIVESGMTYKALSRETGVARASIQRFVDGLQSIRLDMADRLAAFYGLSLQAQKRKKK
jgi:plasmid maintenance system antidote protein VapI